MADKLTWRNSGTWVLISFGLCFIAYWIVTMLFAWSRAREGAPGVGIDAVAASTTLALKGVAVGIVILVVGVVLRLVIKPQPRRQ